jgi:hypothetical protein
MGTIHSTPCRAASRFPQAFGPVSGQTHISIDQQLAGLTLAAARERLRMGLREPGPG